MVVTITMTRTSGHLGSVVWLDGCFPHICCIMISLNRKQGGATDLKILVDLSNSNGSTNKVGLEIGPGFSVAAIL